MELGEAYSIELDWVGGDLPTVGDEPVYTDVELTRVRDVNENVTGVVVEGRKSEILKWLFWTYCDGEPRIARQERRYVLRELVKIA